MKSSFIIAGIHYLGELCDDGGTIVHVEVAPGTVTVVAAWMLHPGACVGTEIGEPRVGLSRRIDLQRLLGVGVFARRSRDDFNIIPEAKHGEPVDIHRAAIDSAPPALRSNAIPPG